MNEHILTNEERRIKYLRDCTKEELIGIIVHLEEEAEDAKLERKEEYN